VTELGAVRVRLLAAAIYCTEAALYSVLTPLAPSYAHRLDLSQAAVGVLLAAYPAGQLPGAALSNRLSGGRGSRAVLMAALASFALATALAAIAPTFAVLVAARAGQGFASGCLMAAGIAWLSAPQRAEGNGETMGLVWGAAAAGGVAGPALAALALSAGARPVLLAAAVLPLALTVLLGLSATPVGRSAERQPIGRLLAARPLRRPIGTVVVVFAGFGFVVATAPLRLAALGTAHEAIALTILVAYVAAGGASYVAGQLADHHRGDRLMRPALVVAGLCCIGLVVVTTGALASLSTALFLGIAFPAASVPACAALSDVADGAGLGAGAPAAVILLATFGESAGSAGGAALAQRTSALWPAVTLAVLLAAVSLPATHRACRGAR
jgi:predicted MFS family arabinose efflux permease